MSSLLEQHFRQDLMQTCRLFLLNLVCVGLLVAIHCESTVAQSTNKKPTGSSHRSYRAAGIKAIPYGQINAQARKRIKDVVDHTSFYRRLPVQTIDADPEYFRLLVRKPELIVSIWQLMGVTQMSTERTGPFSVQTNDGAGTISDLELIYGNDRLHVFYGNGSYTGPLLKQKLTGRCVIVLQTQSIETANGFELTNVLDIYLRVDNATASLITRTIQPLVGTTADHNFTESLKFVQRLNQSTRVNGPGVKGMGRKLQIDAQVRQDFEQIVDKVYTRANKKNQRMYLGTTPSRVSAANRQAQGQQAQQVALRAPRVQVAKPQVNNSPPRQSKLQPVIPPNMIDQSAPATTGSRRRFVQASKSPALTAELPSLAKRSAAPVQLKLSDVNSRPGISVLVGGPRNLPNAAPPVVSVADQTELAKPQR